MLDDAPCGWLRVDDSGTVVAANRTLAGYLEREVDEIAGRHIDQLLSGASRIFYSTHLFPLLRLAGRADELYMPMRHADGTEVPMLVNGVRRDAAGDEPASYELVLVPIRERLSLEDQLIAARNAAEEASAAKDRFLSIVSHELRSPLSGITGFSELLLRERRGPLTEGQRTWVERIRDAALYQAGLIEDILDFAALGQRRTIDSTAVAVEDILARAESILALRAEEEGRVLQRTPRPAPGRVVADARSVQQILLNLGTNAIKYGRPGTPITVEAAQERDRIRLLVRDEGHGIPPEQLERVFEPFVRLEDPEGSSSRRGVGLGLAISRDLARAMRGELTVTSEVGVGSTFVLELPSA